MLQLLLQRQGALVVAHQQRQDRALPGWARPASRLQPVPPALGAIEQLAGPLRLLLDLPQGRQRCCGQGRGQGCGVAVGAGVLQQPLPHQRLARQKGAAAAKGFAEGAADQAHASQAGAQAAAAWAQHTQGMGFIQEQGGFVALAQGTEPLCIGGGALH